jgi:hypothetical protein
MKELTEQEKAASDYGFHIPQLYIISINIVEITTVRSTFSIYFNCDFCKATHHWGFYVEDINPHLCCKWRSRDLKITPSTT